MKTVTIGARISEELDRDLVEAVGSYRALEVVAGGGCVDELRRGLEKPLSKRVEEGIKASTKGGLVELDEAVVLRLRAAPPVHMRRSAGPIQRRPTSWRFCDYIAR